MNFYMPRIIVHHKQICSVFQHEKICSLFLPWPFWKLSYRYEWLLWIHTLHRFYIHVLHHSARDRVSHHTDCHAWYVHGVIAEFLCHLMNWLNWNAHTLKMSFFPTPSTIYILRRSLVFCMGGRFTTFWTWTASSLCFVCFNHCTISSASSPVQ